MKKCFECGDKGQLLQFRCAGKLLSWCMHCIEQIAWERIDAELRWQEWKKENKRV
jgi:hypothetical protein